MNATSPEPQEMKIMEEQKLEKLRNIKFSNIKSVEFLDLDSVDLIGMFDDILKSREGKVKSAHYPSGARIEEESEDGTIKVSGSCLRAQYYYWLGESEQEEIDTSGLWKMDIGNAIHEWIADKASEVLNVVSEYPIIYHPSALKYPIRGRIDNLIIDDEIGNCGIEIKSGYGSGMTNRNGGVKYNGPKISHLLQAFIYLCVSKLSPELKEKYMPLDEVRTMTLPELEYFILFYIARDNAYRKQFYVTMMDGSEIIEKVGSLLGESRTEKIRERKNICVASDGVSLFVYENITLKGIVMSFMQVEKYVEIGTPPPRDFGFDFNILEDGTLKATPENKDKNSWECSYCRFNQICWIRDKDL